ncbi:hypothetical protein Zm00014a_041099 [Zea mays]|uniref:Uncharacterized protein n=1 Tax=Zea mays TaxID=4577 RepID=A0A3L6DCY7_MAIZE|nr:hypothetical protein Zm00014a_041099 [Zea mays]
MKGFVVVVCI